MTRTERGSCLILLCLFCCIVGIRSCSELQCQVLVEEKDPPSHFRTKAAEEGVRIVYLNFTLSNQQSNGSYKPLVTTNRILPYRWAWAQSISEPMLSLSYDYDVLSLGLLKNQARSMVLSLKELQSGCLHGLNSSCQDIVIARALLDMTRKDNGNLPNERNHVVCVRVIQEYSFGVGGGFKYQCCGEDRLGNKSKVYCKQSVKESEWLAVFNAILALVVSVVFLYWPLILCAIPDFFFKEDYESLRQGTVPRNLGHETSGDEKSDFDHRKLHEIPVDDLSPITCATIFRTFAEKLPKLNHGFNVKLFFHWYCVIPIFFYIKVLLYVIIKRGSFDDASRKLIFQLGDFYLYVFSMSRPLVYVLFIFPLFVIPGFIFSSWSSSEETAVTHECCLCREQCPTTPQEKIVKHVQVLPQMISNISYTQLKDLLDRFKCKCRRNRNVHSQHSVCGHAICVLWSIAFVVITGPIIAMITILVYFFVSVACIIIFSPYVCIMMIAFRFIRKQFISKSMLFLVLLYSTLSVCIVAIFSCQFVVRMFGFIVMGITLNAEFAVPYITFVFVVGRNVYLCYSNLQTKYKEVKEMILEQLKKVKEEEQLNKVKEEEYDTIPTKLFWFVCNDSNVLPVTNEVFIMLWKIVFIVIFLIVALAAILLFRVEYNLSAVVSSIAVFLSGKISELFFTGVTTGQSFIGWEKIRKAKMIQSAVKEFAPKQETPATTKTKPQSEDVVDSSHAWHETSIV